MKLNCQVAFRALISSALAALIVTIMPAPSRADCPYAWIPDDGLPGTDGNVARLLEFDDGSGSSLFVLGAFERVGRVSSPHLARWDGALWHAVSAPTPLVDMTVFNGRLIAVGILNYGDEAFGRVAAWDGHVWTTIADHTDTSPEGAYISRCVAYHGDLYVCGHFSEIDGVPAQNIAKWNGATWSPVGVPPAGALGNITRLAVWHDKLITAGGFWSTGPWELASVASWDGASWTPLLEFPAGDRVSVLYPRGDRLIIGGYLSQVGNIGEWDGQQLIPLGDGIPGGVNDIAEFNNHLFAAAHATYSATGIVLRLNGDTWSPLPDIRGDQAVSLCRFGNELVAAGSISLGHQSPGILRWNGRAWRNLTGKVVVRIEPSTTHFGDLIGAGEFQFSDGRIERGLARWDGAAWQPFRTTTPSPSFGEALTAQSYGDAICLGGSFSAIDGTAAMNVASWDGVEWSPLGAGLDGRVTHLFQYGSDLIAGGDFHSSDGQSMERIARWDGSKWAPLGNGLSSRLFSLAQFRGDLIAAGLFGIRRWNGTTWSSVGSPPGGIRVVQVVGDSLYAGVESGLDFYTQVLRWDGVTWTIIGEFNGPSDDYSVTALGSLNNELVASSQAPDIEGQNVGYIARWDGQHWHPLGSGLNYPAYRLFEFNGTLFAATSLFNEGFDFSIASLFNVAGGQIVNGFARWAPVGPAIVEQPDRQFTPTGHPAEFAVSSPDATSYQWRHNGQPLQDDGRITGATTPTLAINSTNLNDTGNYDCVLTNACGSTTSNPAPLRVIAAVPGPPTLSPIATPAGG